MSTPYVGEIRIFAGNYAPLGWELCQGQLLPIAENETLFQLIGTTYGGDGFDTFALPDLRGRLPIHQGTGPGLSPRSMGQRGGAEQVTLTEAQLPAHSHQVVASTTPGKSAPGPGALLSAGAIQVFGTGAANTPMSPQAVGSSPGGGQPHPNMPPFLGVNYIISLFGIFPSPA
jgi:microcystin-dependent protein